MKKLYYAAAALLLLGPLAGSAQCGKPVVLYASKTEYLDANMIIQDSSSDSSIITIDKDRLTVWLKTGDDNPLTGAPGFEKCSWTVPYNNGIMIIKAPLADKGGETKNCILTIESKKGRTTVLIEVEGFADKKMRLLVDTFREKSNR